MAKEKQRKTCDACGGTGQLSYFKGVSRFLLSTEECIECAGTGYQLNSIKDQAGNSNPVKKKKEGKS